MKNRMLNIRMRICGQDKQDNEETMVKDAFALKFWKANLKGSIVGGFRSGCSSGPLCEEPFRGVLVVVEGVEIGVRKRRKHVVASDNYFISRPISGGMVVTAMRIAIRSS